jgi:uncharacterized protein (TIGR02246 family)
MKSNRLLSVLLLVGLAAIVVGCQPQPPPEPPDTRAADEAAIRAASGAWMQAAGEKDADKIMSFIAADAQAIYAGKPLVGAEAIRQAVTDDWADPNYAVTWEITKVKVARSGDLAYEMGTFEETRSDARKRPQTSTGYYVAIWEKQADGTWKATVDIGSPSQ